MVFDLPKYEMQSDFIRRGFAATGLNNLESIRAKTPPGQKALCVGKDFKFGITLSH